jgi:hypothetical protein
MLLYTVTGLFIFIFLETFWFQLIDKFTILADGSNTGAVRSEKLVAEARES